MEGPRATNPTPRAKRTPEPRGATLASGAVLGPYVVADLIGAGGMGEVYKAFDPRLGRHVAIKVLHFVAKDSAELRQRFEREIRVVSALAHRNICTVFDTGMHDGHSFVVMEHVEGPTIEQVLASGPLPVVTIVDVGIQVAEALKEAHEHGLVHRDIKSANIVLTNRGDAKVLDFGIAKSRADEDNDGLSDELTIEGMILGTVPFMSPEQARGEPLDARSDLYSLGVVLYQMSTGALPYYGNSVSTLARIATPVPVPRAAEGNRSLPRALDHIIARALEKDRDTRYQSAEDLLTDLRELRRSITSGREMAIGPDGTSERLGSWASRYRWPLVAAATSIAALAGWWALRPPEGTAGIRSLLVQACNDSRSTASVSYQCRVITANITAALDSVPTITLRYQDSPTASQDVSPKDAGRRAGMDAVLTTRLDSGALGWHAQVLVTRSRTGDIVWSQSYPVAATEVITLPGRIAAEVVATLSSRAGNAGSDRMQPLLQLRQADYHAGLRTAASLERALALYTAILDKDSTVARAWSGRAMARLLQTYYAPVDPTEAYRAAMEAAQTALRYDEGLSEAHAALGLALRDLDWNWARAESELRMAVELDSTSANAQQWYAELLTMTGRASEAERHVVAATRLRPLELTPRAVHGWILLSSNRPDDAAAVLRATLEMSPSHHLSHYFLGATLLTMNDRQGALRQMQEAVALAPDTRFYVAGLGHVLARLGHRAEAEHILQTFMPTAGSDTAASPYDQAILLAGLGDRDGAIRALDRAVSERRPSVVNIKVDPLLAPLRSDPRYAALIRRAGLPSDP